MHNLKLRCETLLISTHSNRIFHIRFVLKLCYINDLQAGLNFDTIFKRMNCSESNRNYHFASNENRIQYSFCFFFLCVFINENLFHEFMSFILFLIYCNIISWTPLENLIKISYNNHVDKKWWCYVVHSKQKKTLYTNFPRTQLNYTYE